MNRLYLRELIRSAGYCEKIDPESQLTVMIALKRLINVSINHGNRKSPSNRLNSIYTSLKPLINNAVTCGLLFILWSK